MSFGKNVKENLQMLNKFNFSDLKLYIVDDISTDTTPEIIYNYRMKYPTKVFSATNNRHFGTPQRTFVELMSEIEDDYIFLSDQDDLWLPNKFYLSLQKMCEMEQQYSKEIPILIHTDLTVVDENLREIAPSYRKRSLHPDWEKFDFNKSLIMNNATGSTICYNRAFCSILKHQPQYVVMHDWWLLQLAYAFGKVGHVYEPTVLYRQHGKNLVGSKNLTSLKTKISYIFKGNEVHKHYENSFRQADSLTKLFVSVPPKITTKENENLVNWAVNSLENSKLKRFRNYFNMVGFGCGFSRAYGAFLFI
jgi:glycosyltransferase involved in cell wall biosynthesis